MLPMFPAFLPRWRVVRVRFLVCLSLVMPLALSAQQPPSRVLAKPDAEFAESFDQILAVRELPSGKVLVTDLGPKAVLLADFASGTQTKKLSARRTFAAGSTAVAVSPKSAENAM